MPASTPDIVTEVRAVIRPSGDAPSQGRHLGALTSLRFFAAALVFFYHFGRAAFVRAPGPFRELLTHGRDAVTFFFLLSGFVLTFSYFDAASPRGMRTSSGRFWMARFTRIYPSYALALMLPLPHKLFALLHGLASASQFSDLPFVITLTQAWIPSKAGAWNPAAWSLSVEAFFYVIFPVAVMLLARCRTWAALSISAVAVMISTAVQAALADGSPGLAAFFPLFHLPVFCLGMSLGKGFVEGTFRLSQPTGVFCVAAAWITAALMFAKDMPAVFRSPSALVFLYGAIVLASSQLKGVLSRIISCDLLIRLGESSYVFYIIHMPVTVSMGWLINLFVKNIVVYDHVLMVSLLFAFNVYISMILHAHFEVPVRNWLLSTNAKTNWVSTTVTQ